MYQLRIILRYLRRKLSPLFAALAVTLCTAMVIIVISVMGGFLRMMQQAVRTLEGDVIIAGDLAGFPHYQQLLHDLEQLPGAQAATALIRAYGLVNLSEGQRPSIHTVEVLGIDPPSYDRVVQYRQTLHWTRADLLSLLDRIIAAHADQPDQLQAYHLLRPRWAELDPQDMALSLRSTGLWSEAPGMVLGIHVSPSNIRDRRGRYDILNNRTLGRQATLTVVPLTSRGGILEPATRRFIVVNEFKSGLYEIDANRVYVPFDLLQKMLRMDAYQEVDPDTAQPTGRTVPARCSMILLRAAPGVEAAALKDRVVQYLQNILRTQPEWSEYPLYVYTWQERHATFLGAVEKEKFLVTILFAIISLVAVAMIGVIFYMIVLEKTRDIGVLRALGASPAGIAGIFLGYGLALGLLGAFLGFWLAAAVVWNINELQDWLTQLFGLTIWNPEVYYFDRVPSRLDPLEVAVILIVAVLASLAGSVIPAFRAATLNPVEALRYE